MHASWSLGYLRDFDNNGSYIRYRFTTQRSTKTSNFVATEAPF